MLKMSPELAGKLTYVYGVFLTGLIVILVEEIRVEESD